MERGWDGHENGVFSAAFSPDGKRVAAPSDDKTVSVWSALTPLQGTDDQRLWIATSDCMPIERRIKILGVSEATAQAHQEVCLRRAGAGPAAAF